MTSGGDADGALVISDAEGNLYLISGETLLAGRVFEELKARVEQLMTAPETSDSAGPTGCYQVVGTVRVPGTAPATLTVHDTPGKP